MKTIFQWIGGALFPPLCLHCKEEIKEGKLFCMSCLSYFLLNDEVYNDGDHWISFLFQKPSPPWTLYQEIKRKMLPFATTIFASYILIQIQQLHWPWPYKIVTLDRDQPLLSITRQTRNQLRGIEIPQEAILFLEEELFFTRRLSWHKKHFKTYRLALFAKD